MSKYTKETFKEIRKETFDRYHFFNCKQEVIKALEKIHSKINQKAALCTRGQPGEKHLYTRYVEPQIQIDLLSEDREPIGTLQYALGR